MTVSSTSVGVFTIAFLLKFTDACAVSTLSALFATAGVAERSENSDSTADLSWEVQTRLLTTLLVAAEEVGQAINELSRELSTNQFAPLSHRQGRNLGSTFGGVCSYNARQIGRGLRIARRKVQYYTWLLGG